MEGKYFYRYPRPAVATDCVIFGYDNKHINVLLIKRGTAPYLGAWALPGGFLNEEETLINCAERELSEETGVSGIKLREASLMSDLNRDPRDRVISVVYYGLLGPAAMSSDMVKVGSDASELKWIPVDEAINEEVLAFDHKTIVMKALDVLKKDLNREPVAFELLDTKFTIKQLQRVYELILGREFDRANFHKKMVGDGGDNSDGSRKKGRKKNSGILLDTGEVVVDTKHKPAKYYSFDRVKYNHLMENDDFSFGF